MPHNTRLNAVSALRHIIFRGVEQQALFRDDHDRLKFLDRLWHVLSETSMPCYAWAIICMKHTGRNRWRRPLRLLNCEQPQFPCLYPLNHYQPPPLLCAHPYVPHSPDHPRGPFSAFLRSGDILIELSRGHYLKSRDIAPLFLLDTSYAILYKGSFKKSVKKRGGGFLPDAGHKGA